MIFDTHCHLYDDPFTDLKDVIKRAQDNKVELMLIPSDNIINSKKSIDLASKYSFIYSAIGIFPGEVDNLDLSCLEEIEKLAQNKKVKAIGEIGLDYHYYQDNKEKQKILLQTGTFYNHIRDDLPDETECSRACKYLYLKYDGACNDIYNNITVCRNGGRFTYTFPESSGSNKLSD